MTTVPGMDLQRLKANLSRGLPAIVGDNTHVALISNGKLPQKQTTKRGVELSVEVLDDDACEWARTINRKGVVYIARTDEDHAKFPTVRRFFPLSSPEGWKEKLLPNALMDPEDEIPAPLSPKDYLANPVIVGSTVGTIAGSMTYAGTKHWIRPLGFVLAGLFLGVAEVIPYPAVSFASSTIINKTTTVIDLAADPSGNFWAAFKAWLADARLFVTTVTFVMDGVWYLYLSISGFLAYRSRLVFGLDSPTKPVHVPVNMPIVIEPIDSAATSGQSDIEVDIADVVSRPADQLDSHVACQGDLLILGEYPREHCARRSA